MAFGSKKEEALSVSGHLENAEKGVSKSELSDSSIEYDEEEVKKIKWKVDMRLCVVVAIMYTICQIDRNNLGNAHVAGMGDEIDLTGNHYSTMVVTFFPFYTLFQPPMTVIARKVGPRLFLGAISVAWGLVMVGFGLVHDWKALVGLRCILGFLEAGFFPSCVFLIGTWYVRHETAKRMALFYLLGSALSGFGGILAYGLQQMDGVGGRAGWRWIFIIEGILTVLIGFFGFVLIVDFPEEAKKTKWFLTEREVDIMIDRVDKDRGDAHVTPFVLSEYLKNALDWKSWLFASNFGLTAIVIYAQAYFLPIVLKEGLNFSVAASQTLVAPCWVFGGVLGFAESWVSDKYRHRAGVLVFNALIEITGVCVLGYAHNNSVRYFGAFLLLGSATANLPITMAYQSNNITGQWRRAFGSALIVGSGGIGGVVGSLVFRDQDKPDYRPGLYTCLVAAGLSIISVSITTVYMMRKNAQQKRHGIVLEGTPGFTYTL